MRSPTLAGLEQATARVVRAQHLRSSIVKSVPGILLSLCVSTLSMSAHAADALDKIKGAGVIKVGMNTD